MTVETLIKQLEKMPKNAKVKIFYSYDNYSGCNVDFIKECLEYDEKTKTVIFNGTAVDD